MRRPDSHTPRPDSPQPPQPEAALLDLLLSPNGGARDNALSALGDQVERFKCIAREFNLTRTASFVEEPSSHCGTSIFDVDTRRTVIPSIKEISITFSSTPTSASTPQEVSISLTCLLQADTPREEIEVLRKAFGAYTPETVLHDPPSISISIHNHRVDAVRDLEAIFELIHKPCGVHPNMNIAVLTRAILELPELNHRAIEIFRSRILKVATDYRDHGPPENEKVLNKLLVQAIRAQGAISLFEAPDHLLSESSVHHWAGATKVFIDTVFLHREGPVPCESIDYLAEVMRDFAQQEDLRGMCGIASVLAIGRQEAILAAHYGDDFFDISLDEQLLNSTKEREVEAYQKLLDKSLTTLTGLARNT